ncbi:uncharacterized protein SEPMUDRAFT_155484 [Sphaerulina musiva SO2202]|uniref:P-loop containing nucleoside triphosphate hydrolase protein n=1 Tax=Sphaerulina musiva (strain SO2202) TaxID=692275 RepID=M3BYD6_SPHMS|nr:uncharacterized protein SEPMUDRAFT_155484 [Sphaerulina musiva SO2202]EMF13071.1 hypothetical protein SEPMUDRAFT_155484 [Sphaerulina musiva SO2202]
MAAKSQPLFVYINGYPGVGKLSVARELRAILPNTKVFDNHNLIDATSSIYERGMPEYQPLRRQMRRVVLDSIATSESTREITWIFTDQQSSDETGASAAQDYAAAAQARQSSFVSIILTCDLEENVRRLTFASRGGESNTKLTDVDILHHIRDTEDIYHFGGELEIEIDVTHKAPDVVAREIEKFIGSSKAM